jgi:predicted branched-subunit amino acid permease
MSSEVGRSGGYLAGVRAGLPFALVVGVVGFYFGVLARSLGWGVIAPPGVPVLAASGAALLGLKGRSS